MQVRILGPVEVVHAGTPVAVAGVKPRVVLAYLVIHAGKPVSVDSLAQELWGDDPPASATNTIQTYVSQLRRILSPGQQREESVLRTLPGGYALQVGAAQLDSIRFEQLLRDGRITLDEEDGAARAATLLRQALELWRGPALADVRSFPAVGREADRLDQLRLLALELRLQADLLLGRHAAVTEEARELAAAHPEREVFTRHAMLALYRCGRQAEALAVFRMARAGLVEELGVEPGAELRRLEQQILRQDPTLAPPPGPRRQPAGPRQAVRPRRRWPLVAAVTALIVAGTLAAWAITRSGSDAVFNEFDLAVHPGVGYDLDIPPGRPADWHATNNPRSPDYGYLDFYRVSAKAPRPHISGVDLTNTNSFNAIHLAGPTDTAEFCRTLPTGGGGNVPLASLTIGSRVCLHTWESRWALIEITRLPATADALLLIHVVVLEVRR